MCSFEDSFYQGRIYISAKNTKSILVYDHFFPHIYIYIYPWRAPEVHAHVRGGERNINPSYGDSLFLSLSLSLLYPLNISLLAFLARIKVENHHEIFILDFFSWGFQGERKSRKKKQRNKKIEVSI